MFSKTFGHALRATVFVLQNSRESKKTGLKQISKALDIPSPFLGKIMQDLVRHGIIDSVKGPHGGFFANAKTPDLLLTDILMVTDGTLAFEQCALGLKRCNPDNPCLLHSEFYICRNGMLREMEQKTVGMIAEERKP